MPQHLCVVRVPLEHVATHLGEVAFPGCLREVGRNSNGFWRGGQDERLGGVDVERIEGWARFKGKSCGEVVEVAEAGLRGSEGSDVTKIAEIKVGCVRFGVGVAVRAWW